MQDKEYISLSEYANRIGLSRQRVHLLIKQKRKDRIPNKIKNISGRVFILVNKEPK